MSMSSSNPRKLESRVPLVLVHAADLVSLVLVLASLPSVLQANLGYVVLLSLLMVIAEAFLIRLPQGDEYGLNLFVVVAGLVVNSGPNVLAAVLVAGLIRLATATLTSRHAVIVQSQVWRLMIRRAALVAVAIPFCEWLRSSGAAALLLALAVGGVLAAGEVLILALDFQSRSGSAGLAYRPVLSVYAVHVALGAVFADLFSTFGWWGIAAGLLMAIVLQSGLTLLLAITRAYDETILALSRAIDLGVGLNPGESEKVANLAVGIGKRLGLDSRTLEALNRAALLHSIGSLHDAQSPPSTYDEVCGLLAGSCASLEGVPFLASAADLMRRCVLSGSTESRAEPFDVAARTLVVAVLCRNLSTRFAGAELVRAVRASIGPVSGFKAPLAELSALLGASETASSGS